VRPEADRTTIPRPPPESVERIVDRMNLTLTLHKKPKETVVTTTTTARVTAPEARPRPLTSTLLWAAQIPLAAFFLFGAAGSKLIGDHSSVQEFALIGAGAVATSAILCRAPARPTGRSARVSPLAPRSTSHSGQQRSARTARMQNCEAGGPIHPTTPWASPAL
jgi:hypothetical protein